MKMIYLAGPDVFRLDNVRHFTRLKKICREFGVLGLTPFDAGVPSFANPTQNARVVCKNNLHLINAADGVLANLMPFRGTEVDSGTAFEWGYAVAKGKAVAGYFTRATDEYKKRVEEQYGTLVKETANQPDVCLAHGMVVEDFGMPVNLMLGATGPIFTSFETALQNLIATMESQDA